MGGTRRAFAASLALLAATSCGEGRPVEPAIRRVVFVTLDTLRADHLGAYGYPRETSRFLDRLASEGVLFERAYTSMPTTVPSHATLFTSLYPLQHGVLKNGHALGEEFRTLAEDLADWGFDTAAFVSTSKQFGPARIDQGFLRFDQPSLRERTRDAAGTVDAALAWLASRSPEAPFFLWVHLFDPHTPLAPPEADLAAFRDAPAEERSAHERHLRERPVDDRVLRRSGTTLLELVDRYDAEIRFADRQLARLEAALGELGLADGTLWVVASDHGEGLGSHGWMGHGTPLYDAQLRVALIFRFPDARFAGVRVTDVVETVDVAPTLADLLGIALGPSPLPRQGSSLAPRMEGAARGRGGVPRSALAQRRHFDPLDPRNARPELLLKYEPGQKYALIEARHKLIHRTEGPDQLFDLENDPLETQDLADAAPELASELLERLQRRIESLSDAVAPPSSVDAESLEFLEALGYVQ